MTLRQKKLLEELPKHKNIISKAGRSVGYSDNYCNGRLQQEVRKSKEFKTYFDEHTVKRDIKRVKKLVLKAKDYTNYLRATELESKILGLQIDKSEVKSDINIAQKQEINDIISNRLKTKDLESVTN